MALDFEDTPILIAQTGPLNGKRWPVSRSLVIGRVEQCDITIPDRQVSRQHARVYPNHEGVMLEDMESKNGTHCNGKLITEPTLLRDGDVIQIALAQSFVFVSSDATMPLETPQLQGRMESPGRLYIDKRSRRVWVSGKEIVPPLSASQYSLLELLSDHPGRVVERHELIQMIWHDEDAISISDQALDALVRRLRDRLASADPNHNYIITVRGHGLRLDNPET